MLTYPKTVSLTRKHKACVLVPSDAEAAKNWPALTKYTKGDGEAGLERFRKAPSPTKLLLAGRFDGIDLPGVSCRILVLDGLPRGAALLDRFLSEAVKSRELRASGIAIKVVQAIGRIFRSNTDHGVVLLCGDDLQKWLMDPFNRRFLPTLLQQQVRLGLDLRNNVLEGKFSFGDLIDGVLGASAEWDEIYDSSISSYDTSDTQFDTNMSEAFAMEHEAARSLWDGNFGAASQRYREASAKVADHEPALAAWFAHLAGLASWLNRDEAQANVLYLEAAALRSEFGRPPWATPQAASTVGEQASRISRLLEQPAHYAGRLAKLRGELRYTEQNESTKPTEQAVEELGKLLGFTASRPDKVDDKGPDIVWIADWRNEGAYFEAKTGKLPTSAYTKEEIGQCHNHDQYLLTKFVGTTFSPFIVGRYLPVVPQASPEPQLRIMEIEELVRIAEQLERLSTAVVAAPLQDRPAVIQAYLRSDGMLWPSLIEAAESRFATDLQSSPPSRDND